MRVEVAEHNVVFKSGYPTFGTNGHLNRKYTPDPFDIVYLGFRPSGILKNGNKLNYYA